MSIDIIKQEENNVFSLTTTDQFIQSAIESQASVETLERLFSLKERLEAADAFKAFISAMQRNSRGQAGAYQISRSKA